MIKCKYVYREMMNRVEINQAQPFKGHIVDITHTKEGNDKMSIEIKVDRIKKYKITGIDALHEDNLPNEYTSEAPYIYKYGLDDKCRLVYFDHDDNLYHAINISPNDEFTESEMRILNHRIRLAGARLGRINQKTKRGNDKKDKKTPPKPIDDWSGSYTFEV